jgi:hypothetical protein
VRQLPIPGITIDRPETIPLPSPYRQMRALLHETANRMAKRLLPTDVSLADPVMRQAIRATVVDVIRQVADEWPPTEHGVDTVPDNSPSSGR